MFRIFHHNTCVVTHAVLHQLHRQNVRLRGLYLGISRSLQSNRGDHVPNRRSIRYETNAAPSIYRMRWNGLCLVALHIYQKKSKVELTDG